MNGQNEGAYIGLFNISICLPQIVASLMSFIIFPLVGHSQPMMMLIAAILLLITAIAVWGVHEGVTVKD